MAPEYYFSGSMFTLPNLSAANLTPAFTQGFVVLMKGTDHTLVSKEMMMSSAV